MIGFLRVFFILLPISLFVWYMVYHDSFMEALDRVDGWQGRDGLLVINQPGQKTWGHRFGAFLERHFGQNADNEWRSFFRRSGNDVDFVILTIENFWVWMIIAIFLLSGVSILYFFRSYK